MSDKSLVEISLITPRKLIEKERTRLVALIRDNSDWWSKENRSGGARERFGKTLVENTTEDIYYKANEDITYLGSGNEKGYCQICGENFGLDEEFIVMKFSFCDEYSCGMSIHKRCKKLKEIK